jgi:mono/diheme cytochrome c family protein
MTKQIEFVIAACALVWVASSLHSALRAQSATVDGIYTEQQATRGKELFTKSCVECHGAELAGLEDIIPPLAGEVFLKVWTGRTVGDLFEQVSTNMPALAPGSLKPEEAADLVAYILSVSKYPAGAAELAPKLDVLKQIKIAAPK